MSDIKKQIEGLEAKLEHQIWKENHIEKLWIEQGAKLRALQSKLDKAVEALEYSDSLIIELWRRVVPISERENEYLESRVYSQGEINERVLKEIKEGVDLEKA